MPDPRGEGASWGSNQGAECSHLLSTAATATATASATATATGGLHRDAGAGGQRRGADIGDGDRLSSRGVHGNGEALDARVGRGEVVIRRESERASATPEMDRAEVVLDLVAVGVEDGHFDREGCARRGVR